MQSGRAESGARPAAMSRIGLAHRPGTAVLPTCSKQIGDGAAGTQDPLALDGEERRPARVGLAEPDDAGLQAESLRRVRRLAVSRSITVGSRAREREG